MAMRDSSGRICFSLALPCTGVGRGARGGGGVGSISTRRGRVVCTASPAAAAKDRTDVPSTGRRTRFSIALLPGDGIGPEITSVAVGVLDAAGLAHGCTFDYESAAVGGAALDSQGVPLPDKTLDVCRQSDAVFLACIGGPKWDQNERALRPESGLLSLRSSLGLFANLRPAQAIPELVDSSTLKRQVVENVDLMVVRELTGDVYFGQPKGIDIDSSTGRRVGYNNMIYHEHEVQRIAKVAFDVARARGGKLCSVDKANVLDVSQLWRDVVVETSCDYPDVELSHMYVDNAAMQLIRAPTQFDTIVTGNIFGDILSDAASMLVGSLGMLPSASLGVAGEPAVFEPVHGSAPDIAGKGIANPCAAVLSAAMMARYALNRPDVADSIENAVRTAIADGWRTGDMAGDAPSDKVLGTREMGDKIVQRVQ